MKDMQGVMLGFAELIAPDTDAHLVLAGPETTGVADDPEADSVLRACRDDWDRLPEAVRRRVHLACVPMTDGDEAAAIVNAMQRHATVVVQKSLAEGFGLTVTEAMWKARPVVASGVGGIVDQIVSGETGWLVAADDLEAYHASGALTAGRCERRAAYGRGGPHPGAHVLPGRSSSRAMGGAVRTARLRSVSRAARNDSRSPAVSKKTRAHAWLSCSRTSAS